MAAIKIPANVNNSGGNSGVYNPLFKFSYFVTGTPAAVTDVPIGVLPCAATYVGTSASLKTAGASGSITLSPKVFAVAASAAPVAMNSTDAAFASTAVTTNGPASTQTINKDGVSTTTHTGTTGVTDAVLKTDSSVINRSAGDVVTLTTSGTFTSSVGLQVDVWFRDNSGSI
jgi:hypothetical protein